jgi:hypothetical protein
LDRAIADLSSVLYADLEVIDGVVAMEGMGPILGEPKPLGLVLAAEDPIAADIAALFLMEFKGEEIPHVSLAADKRKRKVEFEDLDLDRNLFMALRSPFMHAVAEDISAQYPEFALCTGETCSACEATAMALFFILLRSFSIVNFEATSRFAHAATRRFAQLPYEAFVRKLSASGYPSHLPQATWANYRTPTVGL